MKNSLVPDSASTVVLLSLICFPSLGRADGTVTGWGGNNAGQISPCATNVTAISAGYEHSILLLEDGTVADCGMFYGAGLPDQPITVPPGLSNIVAVSAGDSHSLALRASGTVVAWGLNYNGQTDIPPDLTNVVAISAGARHNLALTMDGTVVGWGYGGTDVPAGITNVVAISAGLGHRFGAARANNLVLKADGTVVSWGFYTDQSAAFSTLSNIVAISAGDDNFYESWLVLQADGTVLSRSAGGVTSTVQSGAIAISCSRGIDHHISLALKSNGAVAGLGYNFYGGPNVPTGLNSVIAIAAGGNHDLALIGTALHVPIANPTRYGNSFSATVPTSSGRVYRLEFKDSLEEPNWKPLPLVAGNGAMRTLTDTTAAGNQRFYRVRQW